MKLSDVIIYRFSDDLEFCVYRNTPIGCDIIYVSESPRNQSGAIYCFYDDVLLNLENNNVLRIKASDPDFFDKIINHFRS